jgi:hypothetical protein
MARIDIARLALLAAQNVNTANDVRRDPPVVKAAKQFKDDSAQTVRSGGALVKEAHASWRRHS